VHAARTVVDYLKGGKDLKVEYGIVAQLSAEMVDTNGLALYVPWERTNADHFPALVNLPYDSIADTFVQ
jgi:hypothetical protein